jgi:integrase
MKLRKMPVHETDPATGAKSKRLSLKWYAVFVDFAGVLRRLPLLEDRRASNALADTVDRLNSLRSANEILPPDLSRHIESMPKAVRDRLAQWDIIPASKAAANKPLIEHLADWKSALLAKGNTASYAALTVGRVTRIFDGCRFATISDISASKAQRFIADLRNDTTDTAGGVHRGISAASFNYYLRDARSFFRWMVRDGRCHENPLAHLQGVNVRADRRHDRRALATDELQWLLDTTAHGPDRNDMSGADRAALYRLAVETGLRAGELRSLTRGSFILEGDEPSVTIAAAYAKNRRQDNLPLKQSTADALAVHLAGKMPTAIAFTMPAKGHLVDMFRDDLEAARNARIAATQIAQERIDRQGSTFLSPVDDAGRYADFHALRHTFISNLAAGGVHPKTAQRLARHSTITLTMDRYTHLRRDDLADALKTLPDLNSPRRQVAVATGTYGESPEKSLSLRLSPNRAIQCNPVQLGAINSDSLANEESPGKISGNIGFTDANLTSGRVPKRFKGTDCKSVIRRFESDLGLSVFSPGKVDFSSILPGDFVSSITAVFVLPRCRPFPLFSSKCAKKHGKFFLADFVSSW